MAERRTRFPDFFIIGAPRCGTTALWTYLRQHPRIFMSDVKEPNYFAFDFPAALRITDWREYMCLFDGAASDAIVGEASTWYMFSDVATRSITEVIPNAKMIIMLRNPIDAAYSAHTSALLEYEEDVTDFPTAWRLNGVRSLGFHVPELCREPRRILYRSVYNYGDQLERLFMHVNRDNVQILISEELFANPSVEFANVLRFLSVEDMQRVQFRVVGATKRQKTGVLASGIRQVVERKRRGSVALNVAEAGARRVLGGKRWRKMRSRLVRKTREVGEGMQLDRRVRQQLMDEIEDEIQRVERLIGRDLSIWRANERT